MNGLPYYKRYPRDFIEGTIGMPFEMKAAYGLILDLIYMQGGTLPDDSRYISGLLGCSVKKWNALRALLLDAGKIEVRGEHLGNLRADKELETLGKLQDKQRENRSRPNKNKTLPSPRLDHTEPDTDTEVREKTEAKASVQKPAARSCQIPDDFTLSDDGKAYARSKGMTAETAPREFERFVTYHKAKGSRFKDWHRAWQSWCQRYNPPSNVVPLTKAPPREVDLGGGWTWMPGDPIEYNRITKDVRDAKHIRDRRMAEAEIAYRGLI